MWWNHNTLCWGSNWHKFSSKERKIPYLTTWRFKAIHRDTTLIEEYLHLRLYAFIPSRYNWWLWWIYLSLSLHNVVDTRGNYAINSVLENLGEISAYFVRQHAAELMGCWTQKVMEFVAIWQLTLIVPCGVRLDPGGSFPCAVQKPSASHFWDFMTLSGYLL